MSELKAIRSLAASEFFKKPCTKTASAADKQLNPLLAATKLCAIIPAGFEPVSFSVLIFLAVLYSLNPRLFRPFVQQ